MTKRRKLVACASVVSVAWVIFAGLTIGQAHGAERRQCALAGSDLVTKHANALCRSLARRAVRERPSKAWSAAWTDSCSEVSDSESSCTFRLTFRDHSLPRSARRPARTGRGQATVTGRTRFHVAYASGCVYPDAYRTGDRS
jgi:hypothetical protein